MTLDLMKSSLESKKEETPLPGKVNLYRTGLCGKAASHQNKLKLPRLHYLALLQAKKHAQQEFTTVNDR